MVTIVYCLFRVFTKEFPVSISFLNAELKPTLLFILGKPPENISGIAFNLSAAVFGQKVLSLPSFQKEHFKELLQASIKAIKLL